MVHFRDNFVDNSEDNLRTTKLSSYTRTHYLYQHISGIKNGHDESGPGTLRDSFKDNFRDNFRDNFEENFSDNFGDNFEDNFSVNLRNNFYDNFRTVLLTILWTISLKILWKISRTIPESRIDTMKVGLALSGTISDISRGQFQGQLEEQFHG